MADFTDLQQRFLDLAKPGKEERGIQDRLSNLIASRELGLQKTEERPIATPFITGQQAAITNRAARQAIPLQTALGAIQARRQAAADILGRGVQIERQNAAEQRAAELRAKQEAERSKGLIQFQGNQDPFGSFSQPTPQPQQQAVSDPFLPFILQQNQGIKDRINQTK